MLMPLERIRVGINSESASHTQTPGPTAKNAMKQKIERAVSHPWRVSGTGVISAFSIFNGAARAWSRSANGFEKNAATLVAGTQFLRLSSIGAASGSSDRVTFVATRNPP